MLSKIHDSHLGIKSQRCSVLATHVRTHWDGFTVCDMQREEEQQSEGAITLTPNKADRGRK